LYADDSLKNYRKIIIFYIWKKAQRPLISPRQYYKKSFNSQLHSSKCHNNIIKSQPMLIYSYNLMIINQWSSEKLKSEILHLPGKKKKIGNPSESEREEKNARLPRVAIFRKVRLSSSPPSRSPLKHLKRKEQIFIRACVCMCMCMCVCVCVYIYIYIYIERERERERLEVACKTSSRLFFVPLLSLTLSRSLRSSPLSLPLFIHFFSSRFNLKQR
jgi:hypothetical protein